MSTLQSALFTSAAPDVFQRLENCADGVPNEVASHFALGEQGEHVVLVQEALAIISEREPELGIGPLTVNGTYDAAFAAAVAKYKQVRGILNYAGAIDDIVGRKTIVSLDLDIQREPPPRPLPIPPDPPSPPGPPDPPVCVVATNCPCSQSFTIQLLAGLTGGEIAEFGVFLFDIQDTVNNLTARYLGTVAGVGAPSPLPVSPSVLGQPTPFQTSAPCPVTGFFAFAISSVGLPPPYPLSASPITLSYKSSDGLGQTMPFLIDSGLINLPGASLHAGSLDLKTECNGQPGAHRDA